MASKHGRGTPRPRHRKPGSGPAARRHDAEPEMIRDLRRDLRSPDPLAFLARMSGLMAATDPRGLSPLDPPSAELPTLGTLVDSFIDTPFAETTAALAAIRALTPDEVLAARIGSELKTRRHPLPEWLARLDEVRVEPDVWFMHHVLGDGDNYLLAVTFASGDSLTALVYVDHNMGTVVKDAFVLPQELGQVVATMRSAIDDPDQLLELIDPALARAVVEESIAHGAMIYPPLESDSWPMARPLIEWMVRLLPAGGVVPERREWTDAERTAIADAFLASPFATGLTGGDTPDLITTVLWFGCDYGPGDPLRWSPVNVEILMLDWFPRKIIADTEYLAQLPDVLRAFIRYSHHERGIRASLTEQTLEAVDDWEPEYQRTIRTHRLQGAEALAARLLGDVSEFDPFDDRSVAQWMLSELEDAVGGRVQLMALDERPLPDEPFEWAGIPEDIRPRVQEWLTLCDDVATEWLDFEHRTAMRRFLSRAAVGDPSIFRRKAASNRGAAAVAWVIMRANESFGSYGRGISVAELTEAFGVKGSLSQRAEPLLKANGVDPYAHYGALALGTPDLLTAGRRTAIIARRDRFLLDLE